MDFNEADKKVHPVETQWHYPIMTKYGFVPETMEGTGFVRSYVYVHPSSSRRIKVVTGSRIDYWVDKTRNYTGVWNELEPHLVQVTSDCGRI